jgi:hypothetical protein
MSESRLSRRRFLTLLGASAATYALGSGHASANAPRLALDDPTALALGYVEDAAVIDQSAEPNFKQGSDCANCALWTGGDAEWGGCSIFPGKDVAARGWCRAWAAKG